MKKTLIIILILTLTLSAFTGCGSPQQKEAVAKDVLDETTDAMGQEIKSPVKVPETLTIVSTAASITEVLFALGCGEDIIGVDLYSNYPDQALEIEKIGDFNGFDIEKVISLNPDIVFAGNGLQHEQILALTDAGLNVVSVEPTYYEDIETSITLIGKQVGKEKEAEELVQRIKATENEVLAKAKSLEENQTVYYVMGIGDYGNWTSGEGSFINSVMEMAGGICITQGSELEWIDYPVEDLISNDPDVLIVSNWVLEEDLLNDPSYKDLTAIKEGNYYYINPDIIERPGPRIGEAMKQIQEYLLGE